MLPRIAVFIGRLLADGHGPEAPFEIFRPPRERERERNGSDRSSDGLDAALVTQLPADIPMVEEIARVKGRPRLGDSIDADARLLGRARARAHAPTRTAGCMPAGVIDIGKYAMADRSQRAGTNDCSAAHTAALRIHTGV